VPELIRPASWAEVEAQFHGHGGVEHAARNAIGWAQRFGVAGAQIRGATVVLEAWTHSELATALEEMAKAEPRILVDMVNGVNNATLPPRLDGLPATMVRVGDRVGMIDGKHRANRWKAFPGRYAVLVIQC